jgi:hypothetical protein
MELLDKGLYLVGVGLALIVLHLIDLGQILHALLHYHIVPALADVVLVVLDKVVTMVVPLLVPLVLLMLRNAQAHQVLT